MFRVPIHIYALVESFYAMLTLACGMWLTSTLEFKNGVWAVVAISRLEFHRSNERATATSAERLFVPLLLLQLRQSNTKVIIE